MESQASPWIPTASNHCQSSQGLLWKSHRLRLGWGAWGIHSQPLLLPEYSFQCIWSPLSHFCSGLGQFPGSCLLESCVWEGLYIHTWAQWFSIRQHCTLRKLMEMHKDLSEGCWNNGLEDSPSILAPGSGLLNVLKCMGHPYTLPQMLGVTLLLEK